MHFYYYSYEYCSRVGTGTYVLARYVGLVGTYGQGYVRATRVACMGGSRKSQVHSMYLLRVYRYPMCYNLYLQEALQRAIYIYIYVSPSTRTRTNWNVSPGTPTMHSTCVLVRAGYF